MYRIVPLPAPALASIAASLFALVLAACSGPGPSFEGFRNPSQLGRAQPLTASSPTPIPLSFQTVDDPDSQVNEVTGINQRAKIVGTYGVGSQSNIPQSYTSQPPYKKFREINYPGSQGTVATSLSTTRIIGGYVIDPPGQGGIVAFLQVKSLDTLLTDPNEGGGSYAVTEILGVSDSSQAVGFYMNSNGADVPFQLNIAQGTFADLTPPGATSAQATGINNRGNVTGFETTSSGVVGFFMQAGTYYQVVYPGADATQALSLNWQNQVVGDYQAGSKTHGFILTDPTNGGEKQTWQTVDEPNASDTTVITGINNHDAICGWYKDKSGQVHGFVATPK